MKWFASMYRRLDAVQRQLWFRLAISVVVIVGGGALFGWMVWTSQSLDEQRVALTELLTGQNLKNGDEVAVAIVESGEVVMGGIVYGGEHVKDRANEIFTAEGDIGEPRALAGLLMRDIAPGWAPEWLLDQPRTTLTLGGVTIVWLLCMIWMGLTVPFLLTALGTLALVGLSWFVGSKDGMWLFGGMGTLIFTFVMLSRTVLTLLDRPNQICSVAHTVIREASRTKLTLLFIVLLVVGLPLLPMALDHDQPLRFRVQTFISQSFALTYVVAAILTLVLATSTVAFEIRDRQIWQLMTKPLGRFNYMIGKWLGVMLINLVIMLVAGVSIFMYTQYLRTLPVAPGIEGQLDAVEVRDAVLTARKSRRPTYNMLDADQVRNRVEQRIQSDTELATAAEVPPEKRREIAADVIEAHLMGQRTIPAGGVGRYVFDGLDSARDSDSALMLRFQFYMMESSTHETYEAAFMFNDIPETIIRRTYIPTMKHEILIGPDLIREDGSIEVAVRNLFQPPPGSPFGHMNFDPQDFEIFYKVGSFEGNFLRATLISWIKLSFLAMLGITFATFLSFPVAVLASFTLFIAGTVTPYLAGSLAESQSIPFEHVDWGNMGMVIEWFFDGIVRNTGKFIVLALGWFGEYSPRFSLVEGRLIPWSNVIGSLIKLVVVWTGIGLTIGWLVMRKRELATYSGQG